MLAHAASAQGISAVENMCGRSHVLNHASVPAACFTHPEVHLDLDVKSVTTNTLPLGPTRSLWQPGRRLVALLTGASSCAGSSSPL